MLNPTVILFACANCDTKLTVPVSLGGMSDFCPLCQNRITSPTLEEYLEILKQEEVAKTPQETIDSAPEAEAHASKELDDDALTKSLQEVFKDHPPRPSKTPLETRAESSPEWSTSDLVDVFKHQPKSSDKKNADLPTPPDTAASNPVPSAPNAEDVSAAASTHADSINAVASDPAPQIKESEEVQSSAISPSALDPSSDPIVKTVELELTNSPTTKSDSLETIAEATPRQPASVPIATVTIPNNQALIGGESIQVDFSPPKSSPMTPPKAALNELNLLSELTVPEFQQPIEEAAEPPPIETFVETKVVVDPSPVVEETKPLTSPNWEEPKVAGKESLPFLAGSKPKPKAVPSEKSSSEKVIKVTQKLNILPEGEQSISELLNLSPLEKKRPAPIANSGTPKDTLSQASGVTNSEAEVAGSGTAVTEKSSGIQRIEIPALITTSRSSKRFKRNLSIGLTCFLLIDLVLLWLFQEPIKEKLNLQWLTPTQERSSIQNTSPTQKLTPAPPSVVPLTLDLPASPDAKKTEATAAPSSAHVPKAVPIPAGSVTDSPLPTETQPATPMPPASADQPIPGNTDTGVELATKVASLNSSAAATPSASTATELVAQTPGVQKEGLSPESLPAFQVLENFLDAASWKARIPFIWKAETHSKAIEAYEKTVETQKIETSRIKLYSQNPSSENVPAHCIFGLQEVGSSRENIVLVLFDTKAQSYKVDSQAFIEFRDDHLLKFSQTPGAAPQSFRVTIKRGHVFGDQARIHSTRAPFSLGQPSSIERITAFAPNGQEVARELVDTLGWELEHTYKVRLEWKTANETPYIEIQKIESRTWND